MKLLVRTGRAQCGNHMVTPGLMYNAHTHNTRRGVEWYIELETGRLKPAFDHVNAWVDVSHDRATCFNNKELKALERVGVTPRHAYPQFCEPHPANAWLDGIDDRGFDVDKYDGNLEAINQGREWSTNELQGDPSTLAGFKTGWPDLGGQNNKGEEMKDFEKRVYVRGYRADQMSTEQLLESVRAIRKEINDLYDVVDDVPSMQNVIDQKVAAIVKIAKVIEKLQAK
jgi:hypothetical protein